MSASDTARPGRSGRVFPARPSVPEQNQHELSKGRMPSRSIARCCRSRLRLLERGEDHIAVALLHDPGGTGEQAGVGDVIAMVVRERHIGDVGRR
jgi:hypothetical protein